MTDPDVMLTTIEAGDRIEVKVNNRAVPLVTVIGPGMDPTRVPFPHDGMIVFRSMAPTPDPPQDRQTDDLTYNCERCGKEDPAYQMIRGVNGVVSVSRSTSWR